MPRACYLLQIRDTESETLDEQVVGRIRRNPVLKTFYKLEQENPEIAKKIMIAYVNGVEEQRTRSIKMIERKNTFSVQTTVLKNKIPQQIRNINNLSLQEADYSKTIFELNDQ
jgi:type III restriction enzyme